MSLSLTLRNDLLDQAFGGEAFTPPATLYFALSTTDPGADGETASEPSGGGYARVGKPNDGTFWPAASGGSKRNLLAVQFPMASAAWGYVTHLLAYDAATGGNLYASGPLPDPRNVNIGDIPRIEPSEVQAALTT